MALACTAVAVFTLAAVVAAAPPAHAKGNGPPRPPTDRPPVAQGTPVMPPPFETTQEPAPATQPAPSPTVEPSLIDAIASIPPSVGSTAVPGPTTPARARTVTNKHVAAAPAVDRPAIHNAIAPVAASEPSRGPGTLLTVLVAATTIGLAAAGGAQLAFGGGFTGRSLSSFSLAAAIGGELALRAAPIEHLTSEGLWRVPLLLLLIPPWAVARQVREVTHAPRRWLRTTDLLFVACCAWVLLVATNPIATQWPPADATLVFWLLGGLLVLAALLVSRRMVRATRTVDPRVARLRGRALLAGAVLFVGAWAVWVIAPPGAQLRFVALALLVAGAALLTLTTRLPRPMLSALDLSVQHEIVDSIEQLVASPSPRTKLDAVLAGFADSIGVYGIAVLDGDGRLVASGGAMALPLDMGAAIGEEIREHTGQVVVVAWQSPLAPDIGEVGRARLRVVAGLVQAAIERANLADAERDVAARATETTRKLEQANSMLREANEMKGKFVSLVSHELRTPLTSIIGLARTAEDRWDDLSPEKIRSFQGIIAAQGERLNRVVEDLLVIGRIEEDKLEIAVHEVDVTDVIEQAVIDAAMDVDRVEVSLPRGTLRVRTDRHLLHELLVNYLSNARKYGAPPYRVVLERSGATLDVQVIDHGPGVPDDVRPRLFERFVRGHVDPSIPGSGLGLAIVRELAARLGGSVSYAPNPAGGSMFGLRIPVTWIDEAPLDTAPEEPKAEASSLASHRQ